MQTDNWGGNLLTDYFSSTLCVRVLDDMGLASCFCDAIRTALSFEELISHLAYRAHAEVGGELVVGCEFQAFTSQTQKVHGRAQSYLIKLEDHAVLVGKRISTQVDRPQ